jgi:hypothetical protein
MVKSAADIVREGRPDLTDWIFHFVHGDRSGQFPVDVDRIPTHFTSADPVYWDEDEFQEEDADLSEPLSVLHGIIADGFVKANWAVVDGPRSMDPHRLSASLRCRYTRSLTTPKSGENQDSSTTMGSRYGERSYS